MSVKIEITNALHRDGKAIQITSGDGFSTQYRTTTIVTPYMSLGMRFEDMVDKLVRDHFLQKAAEAFHAWKEGR